VPNPPLSQHPRSAYKVIRGGATASSHVLGSWRVTPLRQHPHTHTRVLTLRRSRASPPHPPLTVCTVPRDPRRDGEAIAQLIHLTPHHDAFKPSVSLLPSPRLASAPPFLSSPSRQPNHVRKPSPLLLTLTAGFGVGGCRFVFVPTSSSGGLGHRTMVISAETAPRLPDPSAESASATETGATSSPGVTQGSLLHNFSFPILKTWGRHRVLRCMSVNGKGEAVAGGRRRSAPSPKTAWPRIRASESGEGDDPGIEEVREKLLVHLREAADRMKLAVPLLRKSGSLKPPPEPTPEPEVRADPEADTSSAPAAVPWNLRTRRGAARATMEIERHLGSSPPGAAEKRTVRLRSEDSERRERPKFSISLTREEIDEDIYAVTGCRARRRPRKRARVVQKRLDVSFFPDLSFLPPSFLLFLDDFG
ncbi:hypothetical protein GW17_00025910, partial [Ensete ventricosum]